MTRHTPAWWCVPPRACRYGSTCLPGRPDDTGCSGLEGSPVSYNNHISRTRGVGKQESILIEFRVAVVRGPVRAGVARDEQRKVPLMTRPPGRGREPEKVWPRGYRGCRFIFTPSITAANCSRGFEEGLRCPRLRGAGEC